MTEPIAVDVSGKPLFSRSTPSSAPAPVSVAAPASAPAALPKVEAPKPASESASKPTDPAPIAALPPSISASKASVNWLARYMRKQLIIGVTAILGTGAGIGGIYSLTGGPKEEEKPSKQPAANEMALASAAGQKQPENVPPTPPVPTPEQKSEVQLNPSAPEVPTIQPPSTSPILPPGAPPSEIPVFSGPGFSRTVAAAWHSQLQAIPRVAGTGTNPNTNPVVIKPVEPSASPTGISLVPVPAPGDPLQKVGRVEQPVPLVPSITPTPPGDAGTSTTVVPPALPPILPTSPSTPTNSPGGTTPVVPTFPATMPVNDDKQPAVPVVQPTLPPSPSTPMMKIDPPTNGLPGTPSVPAVDPKLNQPGSPKPVPTSDPITAPTPEIPIPTPLQTAPKQKPIGEQPAIPITPAPTLPPVSVPAVEPPKPSEVVPPATLPPTVEPKTPMVPITPISRTADPKPNVAQPVPNTSFDADIHSPTASDSYESISQEFYNDRQFAAALKAFNKNMAIKDVPHVEVPPLHVLKRKFPTLIRTGAGVPTSGSSNSSAPVWHASTESSTTTPRASRGVFRVPQGGMTMQEVAKQVLEDWKDIWKLNPEYTPDVLIPAGTELKLPAR